MRFLKRLFGARESAESKPGPMGTIVRWSDNPSGLPLEECARKGIEAVAGFVISKDIFGSNNYPSQTFCTCVELYHAVTGTEGNFGDFIGVYFRGVEFRDGTYPLVGQESLKMLMQPLSDGTISARWNAIDRSRGGQSLHGVGMMADDENTRSDVCRPLVLGTIPEQEEGDANIPSFLILRDPGAGWQIWRRFSPLTSDGSYVLKDGFREETYTMVYPQINAEMNWRFKLYDLPDGGVRVEMVQGSQG